MKSTPVLIIALLIMNSICCFGQFGEIRGTVTDTTGFPLPGATVTWKVNGSIKGAITDANGGYLIKPLLPGFYDLEISYVLYKKQLISDIPVSAEKATYADARLVPDNKLPEIVIKWQDPMIDKGSVAPMTSIKAEAIEQSVARDVISFVATAPGVYQKDEGGSINIRGSRDNNTLFIVDGIKMTGPFSIPKGAIAEISVLTGGIPAQFGDLTGGVVIITTKSHKMR